MYLLVKPPRAPAALSPEWVLVSPLFINWLIYNKGYRCFLGRTEQGAKFAIKLPLITAPKVFARAGRRSNKPAELEALVDVLQKLPKTLRNGRRKKSLN